MNVSVKALPSAAFFKLALAPHRSAVLDALKRHAFCASVHLEFAVAGVPGVHGVAVFAWPEPLGPARRVVIDVVRLDQTVLRAPLSVVFELQEGERPVVEETPPVEVTAAEFEDLETGRRLVTVGEVTWSQVLPHEARLEREVQQLERDGRPVFGLVDTAVYSFRMTCGCGRVRYTRPNSLHQVHQCRVCSRADRLRKRALSQYKTRHGKPR
ncbi:hypothetical protein Rctr197k_096 [Virus Rctr197k]|nr:hypothetical protein Rctr197k_096 [Virus Rctr197k]